MENKYDLKNKEEVKRYISEKGLQGNEQFDVEEIGNGNMNYVYRIIPKSGESFILKYAAGHTRISEDIPVNTDRIKIEAHALSYLSKYVPEYVPQIHLYDEANHCIIMKDYHNFIVLRDLLIRQEIIPDFADNITSYLVKSILSTSELILDKKTKDKLELEFLNPLCDITKAFVFTEPFDSNSTTNAIYEPNQDFIDQMVFKDQALLEEAARLKAMFTDKKQSLIHGDLHTGSIFTDKTEIVAFDFEFAFIGPIGFDLGNLIANLIFAWLNADAAGNKNEYKNWILKTIESIVDLFTEKFLAEWKCQQSIEDMEGSLDILEYLQDVLKDSAAYAGIELIRRIIGIAHVADITSIQKEEARIKAERNAIKVAKFFLLDKNEIHKGIDFTRIISEIG